MSVEVTNDNKLNTYDLANYILIYSSKRLSNLELSKYLYLVVEDYYLTTGKYLIQEDFICKKFGPIVQDVYIKYCHHGANSITEREDVNILCYLTEDECECINSTIRKCDKLTYWEMVDLVQHEGSLFYLAYHSDKVITKNMLIEYFS